VARAAQPVAAFTKLSVAASVESLKGGVFKLQNVGKHLPSERFSDDAELRKGCSPAVK